MTTFNNLDAAAIQKLLMTGALNALNKGLMQNPYPKNTHTDCNLNLAEHQKYVDALVLARIIDKATADKIKQNMALQFAKPTVQSASAPVQTGGINIKESEFLKARNCLLNYLNTLDISLSEDDLKKIESVVLELEKNAIKREAENSFDALNLSNETAKNRLNCAALSNNSSNGLPQKTFTREEIAKMSTAEFLKNEPAINYQLQNGLL